MVCVCVCFCSVRSKNEQGSEGSSTNERAEVGERKKYILRKTGVIERGLCARDAVSETRKGWREKKRKR